MKTCRTNKPTPTPKAEEMRLPDRAHLLGACNGGIAHRVILIAFHSRIADGTTGHIHTGPRHEEPAYAGGMIGEFSRSMAITVPAPIRNPPIIGPHGL